MLLSSGPYCTSMLAWSCVTIHGPIGPAQLNIMRQPMGLPLDHLLQPSACIVLHVPRCVSAGIPTNTHESQSSVQQPAIHARLEEAVTGYAG